MSAIKKGSTVSLHYTGKFEDGHMFETTKFKGPVTFRAGYGEILPSIDEELIGMNQGESRSLELSIDQGYPRRDNLIIEVPKEKFGDSNFGYGVGDSIQTIVEDGKKIPAKIVSIQDETITIDCNHPLAGKKLNFDIYVVSVDNEAKTK